MDTTNNPSPSQDPWADYLVWNNAIAEEYFTGKWAGVPVYLNLDRSILEQIGQSMSRTRDDPQDAFVKVVRATLYLETLGHSTFSQHRKHFYQWNRGDRMGPPPFIGILGFFSLVASNMITDEQYRSTNYTDRLCDLLKVKGEKNRKRIKANFSEDSHIFWGGLNLWLDNQEGSLGLPTAYAFDYRVNVGIPIAQALVRAHDRQSLQQFFLDYRLDPGQRLSIPDIVESLKEWIPSNISISSSLRRLWGNNSYQKRIASIACQELEEWTGEIAQENGSSSNSSLLSLLGYLRSHPVPRLVLQLRVNTAQGAPAGKYEDVTTSKVYILEAYEQGWAPLSPLPPVADAMITYLKLQTKEGYILQHNPRRIVPLKLDETNRVYIESHRTEINEQYILLVHQTLADAAIAHLNNTAIGNFEVKSDIQGLPDNWILITNVLIIKIIDPRNDDLAVLVPRGRYQLTLAGGFSLPGRKVYDVRTPPTIKLAAPYETSIDLSIESTMLLVAPYEPLNIELPSMKAIESVDMKKYNLIEGDYRVKLLKELKSKRQTLSTIQFRLRSSTYPRHVSSDQQHWLHHDLLDSPTGALSARKMKQPSTITIRGAIIPETSEWKLNDEIHPSGATMTNWGNSSDDHDDPPVIISSSITAPNCLLTGAHHWLLEEQSQRQKYVFSICKLCKREKWHLSIRKLKPDLERRINWIKDIQKDHQSERALAVVPNNRNDNLIDLTMDNLLDALTFSRRGSWLEFKRLASQINDSPWFPIESARMLSALGHIEFALDRHNMRPSSWSISPSTLALLPNGVDAILCGARWPELLERIQEDAEAIGGSVEFANNGLGPQTIVIRHLDQQGLRLVAESTTDALTDTLPFQFHLTLTEKAGIKLAKQLPGLSDIAKVLPTISPSERHAEFFDTNSGKWKSNDRAQYPGAYRITTYPWTFAWRSKLNNELRVGDSRVVKYLAGADLQTPLLAYDQPNKRLIAPLGAALPGLYERAVVLCSGFLPKANKHLLYYESVPEVVASVIEGKLRS